MTPSRINLYIIREIITPFLLGLTIFTFVLLMGRILKLAELMITKGVPAGEVLKLFTYLLPSFFVLTIPLAFLLAILLGLGRLSADSEIIALKSTGVSLYSMLKPVMALAAVVFALAAFLTLYAQPRGNLAFKNQVFDIANSQASIAVEPRIFNDEFEGLTLYTNDVDEKSGRMSGVFIADERKAKQAAVIFASSGRIIPDRDSLTLTLRLEQGSIHRRIDDPEEESYQVVHFATYDVQLNIGDTDSASGKSAKKAKEMTLSELVVATREAKTEAKRNAYAVEMQQRFALPFSVFLFALVGVPLSIRSTRSGRGGGFAVSLCVVMIYFFLFAAAETIGEAGMLPAWAAMWIPNLVFLVCGLYLFRQAAREKPLPLVEWLFDRVQSLKQLLSRGK